MGKFKIFLEDREEQIKKIRRIKNTLAYEMGVDVDETPVSNLAEIILKAEFAGSELESHQIAAMIKQFNTVM